MSIDPLPITTQPIQPTAQQPIPPTPLVHSEPKKKKWTLIWVVLIFTVGVIIGLLLQNKPLLSGIHIPGFILPLTPTPTIKLSPSPTINPTATWKTYTSSRFNFSFKYPSDLTYVYDQSNQYVENGVNNAMILIQNFDGSQPRTETDNDFQMVVYIANKSGQFNLEDPQGEQTKTIINGIDVIKSFTTQKWILVPTVFFQSSPNKVAFQLSNQKSTNTVWFDQIVSTFVLLDSPNAVLDSKKIGYIKSITSNGDTYQIQIDYIDFIQDKTAPNGYRIDNPSMEVITSPTEQNPTITMQTYSHAQDGNFNYNQSITFSELFNAFNSGSLIKNVPYWLEIQNGKVVKITEQYIP